MRTTKLVVASTFALANLFALGSAFANATVALPTEKMQGSVAYLTGGIGQDEASAMRHAESKYPLTLEFVRHAKPRDEFLANVDVTIKDHMGKTALKTKSDGPFLLAKLPDGKYTVTAKDDGISKTRHLTIASHKPERIVFAW